MTSSPGARERETREEKHWAISWLPWVVCVVGCVTSWGAWRAMNGQEAMAIEARFQRDAGERELVVEERLEDAMNALRTVSALFVAAGEVEGEQFGALATTILSTYPYIEALGWNPVILESERETYERAARASGLTAYEITEQAASGRMVRARERPEYVAVRFIEPYAGNEAALGFDVASESRRRAALDRARGTGELALTEAITLVQDRDQGVGLLAFVPVYDSAGRAKVADQVRGFVVGVLRSAPLVKAALAVFAPLGIDLQVIDESAPLQAQVLYSSSSVPGVVTPGRFHRVKTLEIGGRRWRIESAATPAYVTGLRTWAPTRTLLAGLGLTLLATIGSASVSGRSARDERLVAQRTAELRAANSALEVEIERRGESERELSAYRDQLEEQVSARTAELEATTQSLRVAIAQQEEAAERQLRSERQAQQAQKLASLGVLAGGIAHDFNNMLVAILGGTDLALQELPEEAPARKPLAEARAAAGRAADLVRQIHAYSGQASFIRDRVDLAALIREMEEDLRAAVAKNVRLQFELAKDLPPIEADETQVRQVVAALLHNASEALGGRSGEISVSARRFEPDPAVAERLAAGDHVVVTVTDNGCGIAEDIRSRIFDPFFSTKTRGQGLGLAATLGIVRSHGGDVLVTSAVDGGTTVEVVLPAAESPEARAAVAATNGSEPWRGSGTALVIDDDAAVRAIAERMLRLIGFEVLTAADGEAGVKTFEEHADAIVVTLLDMNMPRMGGAEAFRRIREIRPAARVVFSSGDSERAAAGVTADDPHAHFLQKPYRVADLRANLRSALES